MAHRSAPLADRPRGGLSLLRAPARALFDLVFPPACVACGRVGEAYCRRCRERLSAAPLAIHRQKLADGVPVGSTGAHRDALQIAVQALKYHDMRDLAHPLADRLARMAGALNWSRAQMIVPVPAHPNRQRQRGYNQAELLAHALADRLGIPCQPGALHRMRDTRSQVGMTRHERRLNVQDAFHADPSAVARRVVLLVDDVYTTGATLHACALALRAGGARAVAGATVTYAPQN